MHDKVVINKRSLAVNITTLMNETESNTLMGEKDETFLISEQSSN
jgi:hypothetical protein